MTMPRSIFRFAAIAVFAGLLTGCSTPNQVTVTDEHRAAVEKAEKAIETSWGTPGQEFAGRLNNPNLKKLRDKIKGDESTIIFPGFNWFYQDLQNSTDKALQGPTWPLPPLAKVPYTTGPVKLDGKLDDPAWEKALTYKGAYPFNTKDYTETPGTIWKLLWDDNYLYVAYQCEDTNILAEKRDRDAPVYSDDCVEIFILPDFRFRTYWELIISPQGSVFDSVQCKRVDLWGFNGDPSQNIEGLKFAIDVQGTINKSDDQDVGYTVEVAIPFNQLPGYSRAKPKAGDKLNFMMVRLDKQDKNKMVPYSYKPLMGWGHNIWNHALMELVK